MPRVKFSSPFNWIAFPREHIQYPAGFEGAVPEAAAVAARAAGALAPDPKEKEAETVTERTAKPVEEVRKLVQDVRK